ncbi:MAG TPA: TonB-dependent receptor [Terriglobales bacterium]|nr:TonB-dependent receptor [Terriglobales bacterium]
MEVSSQAPPQVLREIHGTVKSGSTRLPGVTISAANTLTGKKVLSSTDAQGTYLLIVPSNGRYVVRAEFAAFAPITKEVLINAANPVGQADLEMILLSRVPKEQNQQNEAAMGQFGSVMTNGRGSQRVALQEDQLSLNIAGNGGDAPLQGMSALANSPDATNESVSVNGGMGQTAAFGRNVEDIRDRIDQMRAQGELPGPQNMPSGQDGANYQGGPGGRGGPGGPIIMMAGRGGLFRGGHAPNFNQPHGSVFYDVGNAALDARPYSLSGAPGEQPSYSSNRFGATVGGPLKIPKVLDLSSNTFFFFNLFGTRATTPYTAYSHVPTEAERNGDFSQTFYTSGPNAGKPVVIYNPLTGAPFANNQVTGINPISAGLLQYIPAPNQPGAQNFAYSTSALNDSTTLALRVMHTFGAAPGGMRRGPWGRTNVNFGLNYTNSNADQLTPFPGIGGNSKTKGLNANAGYTYAHGKITNNFRINFNRSHIDVANFFAGVNNVSGNLGIGGISQNPLDWGLPNLSFSNYNSLNDVAPKAQHDNTLQFMDTVMRRHGGHNLRFGGDFRRMWDTLVSNSNPRGSFVFTGAYTAEKANGVPVQGTGYDFADFLLGYAQQSSIQYSAHQNYRFAANGWDLFAMDDWHVRGNLTINAGLRYEFVAPFSEFNNQLVNLDAAPGFTAVAPVLPGQLGPYTGILYPSGLIEPDRNNWAPRVGVAWKPFSKTVVRAGYGINYNLSQYRSIVQNLAFQPPFSVTQTNVASASQILTLENGFPTPTSTTITNNYGIDPNYRLGYVQMWNLNIQREIGWNTVANIGYTGTKGTGLDMWRAPNRGANGLLIPGVQAFLWETSQGMSNMNAGQLRVRKRLSSGFSVGGTYTFSKSIDNASSIGGTAVVVAQNDLDLAAERGLSSFDQRQRFTGDYTVDLPFGEGRKWLASPGPLNRIFGDWEWSGTFTIASGFPYSARVLGNFSDVARGTNGTLRADLVPGQAISIPNPTINEWFNTGAFVVPPAGQFGNSGRNIIIGPGTHQFNMSLSKDFPIREMMGFEVRSDMTNIFNTPQFTAIDTTVNSPTFGHVISVGNMRTITFSTRFRF